MRGTAGDVGVGSWVERWARLTPDRAALVLGDATALSYADFAARIRRAAAAFHGLDVRHGDRVAWIGPNHPDFLTAMFATARLGAFLAPVNHRLPASTRSAVLADTEPVVLIEHAMSEPTDARSVRHRLRVGGDAEGIGAGGPVDLEALIGAQEDASIETAVTLDDLAFLPHTSGTTGLPKAVMLTHGNLTWNAINVGSVAGLRRDDVTIAIAPFFRVGGTGVNVLPVLFSGGTVVIPATAEPDGLVAAMERHRVTVGFGNPDLLATLVRAEGWSSADLSSIRLIMTGGAPVPERLIRAYLERGVTLLQGYGLSEASPVALLLDPERALTKVGSAGRPPVFVDVRIADGAGAPVRTGVTGELQVRGPNVMAGYWRRPTDTDRTLAGGWLQTGDAARMDGDGDIWIVDRLDAGYGSGGHVVYPGDVERVLLAHPAVADAGVVGIPDPDRVDGASVGAAFVVVRPDADVTPGELLAHARAGLAPHQVPVSLAIVDGLPRNEVGKLVRTELARLAGGRDPGPRVRPRPDGS